MPINFKPLPGQLLVCDFGGFREPEMVKVRAIIVLSQRSHRLAVVVPISATQPTKFEEWHYEMPKAAMPESFQEQCWAKCDMVTTMAFDRLDRIRAGKDPKTGKRLYVSPILPAADFKAIQDATRKALGL